MKCKACGYEEYHEVSIHGVYIDEGGTLGDFEEVGKNLYACPLCGTVKYSTQPSRVEQQRDELLDTLQHIRDCLHHAIVDNEQYQTQESPFQHLVLQLDDMLHEYEERGIIEDS